MDLDVAFIKETNARNIIDAVAATVGQEFPCLMLLLLLLVVPSRSQMLW